MMAGPKFWSHGTIRNVSCCCSVLSARCWCGSRLVLPFRVLNRLPSSLENRDSRSSRATGGMFQCGGVHLEWTYIFGSYVVDPSFGGLPAKWNRRCTDLKSRLYDFDFIRDQEFVRVGVGMSLSPRPSSECRFFCDLYFFVKSWNARWDGREK